MSVHNCNSTFTIAALVPAKQNELKRTVVEDPPPMKFINYVHAEMYASVNTCSRHQKIVYKKNMSVHVVSSLCVILTTWFCVLEI